MKKLRKIREQMKFSIAELSQALRIDASVLRSIEYGYTVLNQTQEAALQERLGCVLIDRYFYTGRPEYDLFKKR